VKFYKPPKKFFKMNNEISPDQYCKRRENILCWMAEEGIALAMFEDTEGRRDSTVSWLCGQPGDALLFLSLDGRAVLVPWDVNMAKIYAQADAIIPYSEFNRLPQNAIMGVARGLGIPNGCKIEVPANTPYPLFLQYAGELDNYDIICRERSTVSFAKFLQAVKDEQEIKIIRKAAEATSRLIDLLEKNARNGKIKTEADAALLIEAQARKLGCEGTGFATLAAGPQRSFAIHAFPSWTNAGFGGQGLSILDFGLKMRGYTTDVTMTFARDLNPRKEKMAARVEKAYQLALSMAYGGVETILIAAVVDAHFAKYKKTMPHALGHGIGLEEHGKPDIRNRDDNKWKLQPGMVFTLEPGLYDPALGGCRLENDILLTEAGPEVLTNSRVVRL
jgi:Xaa-Pro dipeptidase